MMDILLGLLIIFSLIMITIGCNKFKETSTNNHRERVYNKLNISNKHIYNCKVEYCGGHIDLEHNNYCYLDILDNNNILVYTIETARDLEYTILDYTKINNIQLLDKTQVTNNPKLSSVLLFGVVGLAINNKDKNENYYINIEYQYNEKHTINIILGCKTKDINEQVKDKSTQIYNKLNKVMLSA